LDTKKFTVTIDVTTNKNTFGIVRMFLGPRINNKQQLNDNRKNFVELDQFIVKLKQGNNVIKRRSIDFKNVVGEPLTIDKLCERTVNFLRNGGKNYNYKNGNTLFNVNFDTNNNNRGFPHRLILPKGTVGGQEYTLFVVVNDMDRTNYKDVEIMNTGNMYKTFNQNVGNTKYADSNSDSSNDSNDSNELRMTRGRYIHTKNTSNRNIFIRYGNDDKNYGMTIRESNNNWCDTNGVKIYNCNRGNMNVGNGNGILDNRALGFPLDRSIVNVNGFVVDNMFFKDVTVYHEDTSNNY
jgi:Hemocyanin, ig-like domain